MASPDFLWFHQGLPFRDDPVGQTRMAHSLPQVFHNHFCFVPLSKLTIGLKCLIPINWKSLTHQRGQIKSYLALTGGPSAPGIPGRPGFPVGPC